MLKFRVSAFTGKKNYKFLSRLDAFNQKLINFKIRTSQFVFILIFKILILTYSSKVYSIYYNLINIISYFISPSNIFQLYILYTFKIKLF